LRTAARPIAATSTPRWEKKRRSSIAITAATNVGDTAVSATSRRSWLAVQVGEHRPVGGHDLRGPRLRDERQRLVGVQLEDRPAGREQQCEDRDDGGRPGARRRAHATQANRDHGV
jgi:hypothetical protein